MPSRFYDIVIRVQTRTWSSTRDRASKRALAILASQGFLRAEVVSCEVSPQRPGELPISSKTDEEGNTEQC
jgi:hypothetical protein